MEKRSDKKLIRIVVTGPESTGKTNIADFLAAELNAVWIPEYARYYVSSLKNKYDYSDIERIAQKQIEDYHHYTKAGPGIVIFDTWLIITKIWFDEVYRKHPAWLEQAINDLPVDLYLLCATDIPWQPDSVRENGGAARNHLFQLYYKEIEKLRVPLVVVRGQGETRKQNALSAVNKLLKTQTSSSSKK